MAVMAETARLRLRRLTLADEGDLFEVFADPYAREFYPRMVDSKEVRLWIEWNLRNYETYGFGLWAMELRQSGRLIGDAGLTYQDVGGIRMLEVGYHVVHGERRKGHALEAARACLDFGFTRTEATSICSIVSPSNRASCGVAGRLHFDCRAFVRNEQKLLLFFTARDEWSCPATSRTRR